MTLPSRGTYAGLFLVTAGTVTCEVLLTRIFSVIMWYHFAFVAISVAMFGMSLGAVLVYVLPRLFPREGTADQLAYASLGFAYSLVAYCILHLGAFDDSKRTTPALSLIYLTTAVPFTFSGIGVCLALTRYPLRTARLYCADLIGAACGCLAMIGLLRVLPAPAALLVVALVVAAAALLFAQAGSRDARLRSVVATVVIAGSLVASTRLHGTRYAFAELHSARGGVIYEKWNHFSRVTVLPDAADAAPFGWGLSPALRLSRPPQRQFSLVIDALAATPITNYAGDLSNLQFLKSDIVNTVHYLRPDARVLVIGAGGGRDVLSALVFRQSSVEAVEINGNILAAVNGLYGDFSGHLDRDPRVTFANDEARSYIARQTSRYDIIQASLVDTWAASAAGAFTLTENSLYTVEAWKVFLSHLTDRGVVTFSRWYSSATPWEMYRLTALAVEALRQSGVPDPRSHLLIVRVMKQHPAGNGVGTILVSRQPFSADDVARLQAVAQALQFEVVLTPDFALDPMFSRIASSRDLKNLVDSLPVDISPPSDNRPFFFDMVRLRDFVRPASARDAVTTRMLRTNTDVVSTVLRLGLFVFALTVGCILAPLAIAADRGALRGALPLFLYFGGIGVGFMMVEISQMQRLVVFLGHPTYALTVVLFSLLTFSGLGSLATSRVLPGAGTKARLAALLAALILFGGATPAVVARFAGSPTPLRILLAILILAPIAFLMGMAFPIGIRSAARRPSDITPWLWGLNGATSVCASVLAVVISMSAGIAASFWFGVTAYAVAVVAHLAD